MPPKWLNKESKKITKLIPQTFEPITRLPYVSLFMMTTLIRSPVQLYKSDKRA